MFYTWINGYNCAGITQPVFVVIADHQVCVPGTLLSNYRPTNHRTSVKWTHRRFMLFMIQMMYADEFENFKSRVVINCWSSLTEGCIPVQDVQQVEENARCSKELLMENKLSKTSMWHLFLIMSKIGAECLIIFWKKLPWDSHRLRRFTFKCKQGSIVLVTEFRLQKYLYLPPKLSSIIGYHWRLHLSTLDPVIRANHNGLVGPATTQASHAKGPGYDYRQALSLMRLELECGVSRLQGQPDDLLFVRSRIKSKGLQVKRKHGRVWNAL